MRQTRSGRRSKWRAAMAAALVLSAIASPARAGPVLDRVRAENVVHCGAEERPGIAQPKDRGVAGLAVDLCAAVALAVLGPAGRFRLTLLESSADFDAVRQGRLDLAFLSARVVAEEKLAGAILPGPPAYVDAVALMVPENSPVRRPEDLAGKTVCFMIGSPAQRALEAAFDASGLPLSRLGFEEAVEMRDAYNVGRCEAVADAATTLAAMRRDGGVNRLTSRILESPLALDPIFVATSTQDGAWSAAIAWMMHELVAASAAPSAWRRSGTALDGDAARALGFNDHWQAEIAGTLGGYADMLSRHTGTGSELGLPTGMNAPWPAGLLLPPTPP